MIARVNVPSDTYWSALSHFPLTTHAQFHHDKTDYQLVFGMGQDMSTFLAVYGAVMDGNLISWSIGGPVASLGGVGNVQPLSMSGSHNNYEGDVSPTRGDLYQ